MTFVGQAALLTALGGVDVEVNGTLQGSGPTLLQLGAQLVIDQLYLVPAGGTIRVVVTGLGITLNLGNTVQLTIEKVA